jgi:hypothetical protein
MLTNRNHTECNAKIVTSFLWAVMILMLVAYPCRWAAADQVADPSDWPMFQYNAQHTGYNDSSKLRPPLENVWLWNVFDSAQHLAPVAVADNRVLVTHDDWGDWFGPRQRYVRCLDTRRGAKLWDKGFGLSARMYPPAFGYGLAFIQREDLSASISALTPDSGHTVWTFLYGEQGFLRQSPTIFRHQLLTTGNWYNGMICVSTDNGEWQWGWDGGLYDLTEPSAWGDEVLVFTGGYLGVFDLGSGERKWSLYVYDTLTGAKPANPEWFMGTAPVIDTLQHIAFLPWHVSLTAVDLNTHRIIWQRWGDYGKHCWGISPALVDGQLLVVDSGMLTSIDGQTGEVNWRLEEDSSICYPPVAANGYVYVSGSVHVHAVNLSTHQCEYEGPDFITGWLSIARDRLFVATQIGLLGCFQGAVDDVPERTNLPESFQLMQNYPNPFNAQTTIQYVITRRAEVRIDIYSVLGAHVRTLVEDVESAGTHSVSWNGCDERQRVVSSGVYMYRLTVSGEKYSKKMLLLK